MLHLLAVLFAVAMAGNYSVFTSYSGTDCSGTLTSIVADSIDPQSGSCTPISCQCDANSNQCVQQLCYQTSLPNDPANAIVFASYDASNDCSGDVYSYRAQSDGLCLATNAAFTTSTSFSCGGGFTQRTWNNGNCAGDPASSNSFPISGSACISGGPNPSDGSVYYVCGAKCFHKDTEITYQGTKMSLKDLKASSTCSIPHVIKANGRKITTTCEKPLRVTDEHLVMTPEGFKTAASLKKGDKLYHGVGAQEATCEITNIETERAQDYFGLNCEESHVAADGYWVSTFGLTHGIPAAWMKLGSKIFGIQTASAIGNSVAQFLNRIGLI